MEQIPLNIKKKAFCAEAKNCQNQFSKLEAELWYSWHSIKTQARETAWKYLSDPYLYPLASLCWDCLYCLGIAGLQGWSLPVDLTASQY